MIVLPQPITDSDTTVAITPDPSLPQDNGLLQIESEQITYSTLYMNTLYGCVRGANSTTPAAHAAGTFVTIADFFQTPTLPSAAFPLLASDGTSGAPAYSFSSIPSAGIWWDNADSTAVFQGATLNIPTDQHLNFGTNDLSNATGAYLTFTNGGIMEIITQGQIGFGCSSFNIPPGAAASPAFLVGYSGAGLYSDGPNLDVSVGGAQVAFFDLVGLNVNSLNMGSAQTVGAAAATMTNSPVAGDPTTWFQIKVAGVSYWVPAWAV